MYCLIDCTNYQALATHETYIALSCLAYIQFANVDTVIFNCTENRPFAQFAGEQLDKIANGVLAGMDAVTKTATYTDAVGRCREIINAAGHLKLTLDAETLGEQAEYIKPDDDKPYFIAVGNSKRPVKAKAWAVPPNVNRTRFANPSSPQLTRRDPAPPAPQATATVPLPPSPPKPGAALVPPPPPAPKAPKAPTAPRSANPRPATAEREERNGIRRPAAGSKTGIPWEVADGLLKTKGGKLGNRKDFKTTVIAACKEKGVNGSTANVQYLQWEKFTAGGTGQLTN